MAKLYPQNGAKSNKTCSPPAQPKGKGPGKYFRKGLSLVELFQTFPNDEVSEQWFIKARWPDGMACPRCGSVDVDPKAKHPTMPHRCRDCNKQFSAKTGTIMASSNLGYQAWALAMYQFLTNLKGVSSLKLHRDLDVTQQTSWFLLHRLRECFRTDAESFQGTVEVDETFIGGKRKRANMADKFPLVGIKNRDTNRVQTKAVFEVNEQVMTEFVKKRVVKGADVYTDGSYVYDNVGALGYKHETVIHSRGQYVRQSAVYSPAKKQYVQKVITTNGIESFWAMVKRGYKGVYHYMSQKHLDRYGAEFAGRHNIRSEDTIAQMKILVQSMEGKRLRYSDLVA